MKKEYKLEKKERFNLYRVINNKLDQLENQGKIRVEDFGVKYDRKQPFANLAIGLGLYDGPSVAYIFVDKISNPVEERKYLFFGKKVIRDRFDGGKNQLEKMLEPLGKDVVKKIPSEFSESNEKDILYSDSKDPFNLRVIRVIRTPEIGEEDYDLDFYVDIYHKMYYKDIKKESEKNEK